MKDEKFEINTHWILFSRLIGFPLDKIEPLDKRSALDGNYEINLESLLDDWLKNDPNCSWDTVNEHMEYLKYNHHATVILKLYEEHLRRALLACEKKNILLTELQAEGFTIAMTSENDTSATHILQCICQTVKNEPSFLKKLVTILRRCRHESNDLQELVHKVEREWTKSQSIHSIIAKRSGPTTPTIPLSPTLENDFAAVVGEFKKLMSEIVGLILEAADNFSEDRLKNLRKLLKNDLVIDPKPVVREDLQEMILDYIKNCSILRTYDARNIVKQLEIHEGIEAIENYEAFRQEKCEKIKANQIIKARLSKEEIADCEKITFIVHWDPKDITLMDIEKLIYSAFEGLSAEIHVVRLDEVNSIKITCYAPELLMGLLVFKCQQNLPLLKKKGVISLKIGYCTLLDHKKDFEMNEPLLKKKMESEILALKEENESLFGLVKYLKILLHDTGIMTESGRECETRDESDKLMEEEKLLKPISEKPLDDIIGEAESGALKGDDPVNLLKHALHEKDEKITAITKLKMNAFQEIETLRNQQQSLESEISELKKEVAVTKESSTSSKAQNERIMSEIVHMRGTIETRIPVLSFHSKNIQYPPLTIVMGDFYERKKNETEWCSPAFYSHHEGYKLCLKVVASGHDTGKGSHFSAYIHLMSGEYDDKLSWPFKADIELQLLNRQANEHHRSFFVHFNDSSREEATSRVHMAAMIDSGMVAWRGQGTDKLIQHSDLSFNTVTQTEYLKDNSLFIQCKSIDVQGPPPTPSSATAPPPPSQAMEEFKMENFSSLRAKNDKWESPPFYSHANGYKLVLRVHPNGSFQYKGKSMSVYVHLMKGEFDKNLVFPFRGKIIVQAINQMEDKNHVEFPVMFDEETDPDGKLGASVRFWDNIRSGYSSEGWGISNFLLHDLLPNNKHRNTQYLTDNDQVIFRIAMIEVLSGQ